MSTITLGRGQERRGTLSTGPLPPDGIETTPFPDGLHGGVVPGTKVGQTRVDEQVERTPRVIGDESGRDEATKGASPRRLGEVKV